MDFQGLDMGRFDLKAKCYCDCFIKKYTMIHTRIPTPGMVWYSTSNVTPYITITAAVPIHMPNL